MRGRSPRMLVALFIALSAIITAALGDETKSETAAPAVVEPDPDRAAKLSGRVKELEAKPANALSIAERVELSQALLELGRAPQAVRVAYAASRQDPNSEAAWIALVKAQNATGHQVVYAEQNFQFAIKKFPDSPALNALQEDMFQAQLRYGQPQVAVRHLSSWARYAVEQLGKSPDAAKRIVDKSDEMFEQLKQKRVPSFAIVELQENLRKLNERLSPEQVEELKPARDLLEEIKQQAIARENAARQRRRP